MVALCLTTSSSLTKKMNGKQRKKLIIQQYVSGLLALIEEHKEHTQLKVRATTYIINEKIARKMGFKVTQTDSLQKAILFCNYLNIWVSNSIATNKLSLPNVSKTKTFEAKIGQLIEKKTYLKRVNESLQSTIFNVSS